MALNSTLKVFKDSEIEGKPGHLDGQTLKRLVGTDKHPRERLNVYLASFKPGMHVPLHWHLVEALYYVLSGRAVMKDIEGKRYDIGPGTAIYYPPGIAGSHDWDIIEPLQLIGFRATSDPIKNIQFSVDETSKESSIALDYLVSHGGEKFKSFY